MADFAITNSSFGARHDGLCRSAVMADWHHSARLLAPDFQKQ